LEKLLRERCGTVITEKRCPPMRDFPATPIEMIASLWRNRELIGASVKREVLGRYRGSFLGLLWSFLNPIFMLAVYTFVFSVIFKARWNEQSDSKTEYALILFAGLLVFNLFSECITKSPSLILSNVNYVKKVVFPLEILPWVTLYSALFHAAISLLVWLIAYVIFFGVPQITIFYLPIVVIPLVLMIMGISWILAALGVYLRDIGQIIGISVSALMFLSPIFYRISSLPVEFQSMMLLNPLTIPVEEIRNCLIWGVELNYNLLSLYWILSFLICCAGFAWFQKARKGFADVI
jgi:lipopolysaccharide transport system permease protein